MGRAFPLFAALYHRNYRLYWTGQLISVSGTWMQQVALSWLILELTHSAFKLGVVGAAQFLPVLLFSLYGGILADRFPKKYLIIFTQASMMLVAFLLGMLVVTGKVHYVAIVVLAFLLGCFNAVDMPARQSFILDLVDRRTLMNALALHSALFNGARVVGPALAGVVLARWGTATCFFLNAASFLAVLVQLVRIDVVSRRDVAGETSSPFRELKEAFVYVKETPRLLYPLLLLALFSTLAVNFNVLVPALARLTLKEGAQQYAYLLTAQGLGAVAGGIFLAWLSWQGPRIAWIVTGALALCLPQIVLGLLPGYSQALFLLFVAGWGMVVLISTINTNLQLNARDDYRGRVMSLYVLLFVGTSPVGNLLAGALAHRWGVPWAFTLGSAAALLAGAIVAACWYRTERRVASS
ncbi:MFS transporter [Ammonifex thiophilus]|uniref:MFS transporter n=1 Tax=Ammonifex thiophilus TaxID=444093 RepID=A0A3D8P5F4_9THEO|nr:MFS transporter [Ammonifex thiophilus]RDV83017.1 MFS transporter [Ammonifex thiophilus]